MVKFIAVKDIVINSSPKIPLALNTPILSFLQLCESIQDNQAVVTVQLQ